MKYILYARKSTEDDDRQILSIEAQVFELKEFAAKEKLEIVASFQEAKTAKKSGRMKFAEMLSLIEKGKANGIISWHPDRLARNSVDGGRIIHMIDRGLIQSLKFPTFWFEPTPQGKFMLSVAFGQAKYYTDNLRENILRGIRQKIRRGELSAKAPLGYFNEPRLRTIEPDKKTFNKVKEVLRAFATSEYTLTKIQSKMFSLGLVGKDGKLPHLSTIHKILTNPFYYGHFRYRGEIHQGSHKSMISKKLFDQIQEALISNGKPRKKRGPKNFQFLNFAVCGECGYSITAERHIKKSGLKFVYYRCTHKSKTQNCSQTRFLREEVLTEQVKENCQKVSLTDDWREKYLAKVGEWEKENSQSSNLFAQNLKTELSAIKIKIDRLMDGYLEGSFELLEFQEKKNKLMAERKDIEEKLSDFERKGNHWLELTRSWILEANQAKNLILSENFLEMKNFLKTIGSNRRLAAGKLAIDFKNPWNYLAEMPAEARGEAPSEANHAVNKLWWT